MTDVFSPCCQAPIDIRREVHDVVMFDPTSLEGDTLHVLFSKVYEGTADSFEVTCTACGNALPYTVEED